MFKLILIALLLALLAGCATEQEAGLHARACLICGEIHVHESSKTGGEDVHSDTDSDTAGE